MDTEGLGAAVDAEPARVFMSYRRADDRHFIGRLHDRLCDAFGDERVFRDIDSIPAGTNFRQVILRTLNEVDAVVAVIGPNWARPSAAGDDRAETDYVLLELAEALKQRKPVLPVLMEGTDMPSPDALPADLRALCDINAISVHGDPAFRRDSMRLVDAIVAVVAEERSRVAREQLDAQEQARRVEEERAERERLAEQLRAEEREARARLAELEEAATRRQIEQERARLDDIEARIRQAESGGEPPPAAVEPPTVAERPLPTVAPLPSVAPLPTTALGAGEGGQPWFQILLVAALILGVAGVPLNRSVLIGDSTFQFNELQGNSTVDILEWLLTLAIAVPLLLARRPVEQRFVLAGVVASTFFYEFLQASATVRYGDGYDEGSWILLRMLQIGCLVGAYRIVRQRSGRPSTEPRSTTPLMAAGLTAIAVASAILLAVATHDQWSDARTLIDESFVPDRTPFPVWLLLVALGPIAVTVAMAPRGSYAAYVSLATIATLGTLNYLSEAVLMDSFFQLDGSKWTWVAMSQLLLAVAAWSAVAWKRKNQPSISAQ